MPVDGPLLTVHDKDARLLALARSGFAGPLPERLGIAVSGGGDSVAALHLFSKIMHDHGGTVHAVTVDHGLRAAAADEAAWTSDLCARLGVAHDTLNWHRRETTGNVQAQARDARYGLIAEWAAENGICDVVLGHTANDQAETFLMRLGRSSGTSGLSGMKSQFTRGLTRFHRPLLLAKRDDLRAYLRRNGLAWHDDPTNDDRTYLRVRTRQALETLGDLGITVESLTSVTQNIAAANAVVDAAVAEVAQRIVQCVQGDIVIQKNEMFAQLPEIMRRLLVQSLMWVASSDYAPRRDAVENLTAKLREGQDTTLNGCRVNMNHHVIRISRELNAVQNVRCATNQRWDQRWTCEGPHDPQFEIRVLGAQGLRACPDWRETGLPRASLVASPAIWDGDTLIAAPLAGFSNGWSAQIVADFHSSAFGIED